jgi:hypothetical protein
MSSHRKLRLKINEAAFSSFSSSDMDLYRSFQLWKAESRKNAEIEPWKYEVVPKYSGLLSPSIQQLR